MPCSVRIVKGSEKLTISRVVCVLFCLAATQSDTISSSGGPNLINQTEFPPTLKLGQTELTELFGKPSRKGNIWKNRTNRTELFCSSLFSSESMRHFPRLQSVQKIGDILPKGQSVQLWQIKELSDAHFLKMSARWAPLTSVYEYAKKDILIWRLTSSIVTD